MDNFSVNPCVHDFHCPYFVEGLGGDFFGKEYQGSQNLFHDSVEGIGDLSRGELYPSHICLLGGSPWLCRCDIQFIMSPLGQMRLHGRRIECLPTQR